MVTLEPQLAQARCCSSHASSEPCAKSLAIRSQGVQRESGSRFYRKVQKVKLDTGTEKICLCPYILLCCAREQGHPPALCLGS